jgi:hypothetical protein
MNELLAIKSYWEGVKAVLGEKPPTKEQWKGICDRFDQITVPAAPAVAVQPRLAAANAEPTKPRPVMSSGAAMSAGP